MSSKERVNVWISTQNAQMLERVTKKAGATKASIMDAALQDYLFPKPSEGLEDLVVRRLDRLSVQQGDIEKEVKVCVEALGQFILYWLATMDPMDSEDRLVAQAVGERRFKHFITQVSKKLATDDGLTQTLTSLLIREESKTLAPDQPASLVAAE